MAYRLEAVVATELVLREWAGSIREARIVPLGQHLWLLPMTDKLFDVLTVAGAPELDGFWKAPAGLGHALTACSANGPVAYVEAEYFGGAGTQSAQVWDGGKVVLDLLRLAEGAPSWMEARSPKRFGDSGQPRAAELTSSTPSGLVVTATRTTGFRPRADQDARCGT
jgi:hypothetical protein